MACRGHRSRLPRRDLLRMSAGLAVGCLSGSVPGSSPAAHRPPNILLAIADDQSWLHAGAYGDPVVRTPAFDRVAAEGVLFNQAFCSSPSCTPSRGALLTGRHFWELEEGGNLWSTLAPQFEVYPDLLEAAGYAVGFERKGWGPGRQDGRRRNPAGERFAGFDAFLDQHEVARPFAFWFGSAEPHRPYTPGSGVRAGLNPEKVVVPPHLPARAPVREDMLDYYAEIEQFDRELGARLALLEARDLLEDTLVIVTSDNGMPFPRGKANLYDYGTRMPLAIRWPRRIPGGRVVDDIVNLIDIAPTVLEAAGLAQPDSMTGRSLWPVLGSHRAGRVDLSRWFTCFGRERHANVRAGGVGYPCRAIRTHDYLYIRNFEPERWPAGDPPYFGDVDPWRNHYPAPAKDLMLSARDDPEVDPLFELAFARRPGEELYDLLRDPAQMHNVAADPTYAPVRKRLEQEMLRCLERTGDPRAGEGPVAWDDYPYHGRAKPIAR